MPEFHPNFSENNSAIISAQRAAALAIAAQANRLSGGLEEATFGFYSQSPIEGIRYIGEDSEPAYGARQRATEQLEGGWKTIVDYYLRSQEQKYGYAERWIVRAIAAFEVAAWVENEHVQTGGVMRVSRSAYYGAELYDQAIFYSVTRFAELPHQQTVEVLQIDDEPALSWSQQGRGMKHENGFDTDAACRMAATMTVIPDDRMA